MARVTSRLGSTALLGCLVASVGMSQTASAYRDKQGRYSLSLPAGWTAREDATDVGQHLFAFSAEPIQSAADDLTLGLSLALLANTEPAALTPDTIDVMADRLRDELAPPPVDWTAVETTEWGGLKTRRSYLAGQAPAGGAELLIAFTPDWILIASLSWPAADMDPALKSLRDSFRWLAQDTGPAAQPARAATDGQAPPIVFVRRNLGEVMYDPPPGWVSAEQDGTAVVAPQDADEGAMVVLVLYPAAQLGGQTFRAWFDAEMAKNLTARAKVVEEGSVEAQKRNGLDLLTVVRRVQDAEGAARIQLFHAISDGEKAAMVMGVAATAQAIDKHAAAIREFIGSMDFAGRAPAAGGGAEGPTGAEPAAGREQGEPLPTSSLVNGRPQGLFVGVSILSGRPSSLLFLEGGRIYHGIPASGLNTIYWEQLLAENGDLCGTWTAGGGTLRIEWNDGNVWEGPIEPTATGFVFNGKSYGAARPVDIEHLTGAWEGTRSTAWMNLGPGPSVTQISSFRVAADGSYRWDAVTGGSVDGATAYDESSATGKVEIVGLEAVFRAGDGSTSRLSLARWGDPDILILGGSFYLRK